MIKTNAGSNYFTEAEEKKLFNFLSNRKDKQAERDFCLLKLTRATGLRRGEALALNVGDVYNKSKLIVDARIAEKGAIDEVFLSVEIQGILKRFFRLKKSWGESIEDDAALFISKQKKRLSLRSFNDLMTKWCELAGTPCYTPHALRHTKAQRIVHDTRHLTGEQKDRALLLAQKQLRHKSINSTAIYTQPSKEDMEQVANI